MATVEERLTVLETEFHTELKHLATKGVFKDLEMRLSHAIDRRLSTQTGWIAGPDERVAHHRQCLSGRGDRRPDRITSLDRLYHPA